MELIAVLLLVILALLITALAIYLFVFWILMLVDAAKRKFKTDGEKIAWVLIIIFLHVLGAIIYYFAVKKK